MSDYASRLPVRTEAPGDVDIFISDAVTPSQKLVVEADGSINVNASINTGEKIIITDGTDDLAINNDGSINAVVTATDLDIRDLDAAQDNVEAWLKDEAGVAFSASNPLPVQPIENVGTETHNYNTAAAVASNASSQHNYTTTDFDFKGLWATASGKLKVELQFETAASSGVFNTAYVAFNSTATPNIHIDPKVLFEVPAGAIVRVIRTNLDNQAQDVYSTIYGVEA